MDPVASSRPASVQGSPCRHPLCRRPRCWVIGCLYNPAGRPDRSWVVSILGHESCVSEIRHFSPRARSAMPGPPSRAGALRSGAATAGTLPGTAWVCWVWGSSRLGAGVDHCMPVWGGRGYRNTRGRGPGVLERTRGSNEVG